MAGFDQLLYPGASFRPVPAETMPYIPTPPVAPGMPGEAELLAMMQQKEAAQSVPVPQRPTPMPSVPMPQGEQVPMPQMPAQGTPAPMPPAMQPAQTPEEHQQRVAGWTNILEKMKDPNIMGPMQTFFQTLAAPMAPWENGWSRLGKASAMYNMHRAYLDENAKNQPLEDRMKQAEVTMKEAQARGAGATADKAQQDVKLGALTMDARVQKLLQDAKNAATEGDIKAQELALRKIEVRLQQQYGDEKAQLEMDKIRAQIARENSSVYANNELGNLRKRMPGTGATAAKKDITKMSMSEMVNEVNSISQSFYGSGAGKKSDSDFIGWVKENYDEPYVQRLNQLMGRIKSQGGTVNWPAGGKNYEKATGAQSGSGNKVFNW